MGHGSLDRQGLVTALICLQEAQASTTQAGATVPSRTAQASAQRRPRVRNRAWLRGARLAALARGPCVSVAICPLHEAWAIHPRSWGPNVGIPHEVPISTPTSSTPSSGTSGGWPWGTTSGYHTELQINTPGGPSPPSPSTPTSFRTSCFSLASCMGGGGVWGGGRQQHQTQQYNTSHVTVPVATSCAHPPPNKHTLTTTTTNPLGLEPLDGTEPAQLAPAIGWQQPPGVHMQGWLAGSPCSPPATCRSPCTRGWQRAAVDPGDRHQPGVCVRVWFSPETKAAMAAQQLNPLSRPRLPACSPACPPLLAHLVRLAHDIGLAIDVQHGLLAHVVPQHLHTPPVPGTV